MQLALRGNDDWIKGMRGQLDYLRVSDRRLVGGGFVTDFDCPEEASPVVVPRRENGLPVQGYPPAVNAKRNFPTEGLASFIVWLGQDGRIRQLEACSLTDDQWPENIFQGFEAFQDDNGNSVE